MIEIPADLLEREVDLGATAISADLVRAYAETVGDEATLAALRAGGLAAAPPTFVLALHRGMRPEVPLPAGTFGVYGGHDLELVRPLRIGRTYRRSARLLGAFEKSGRSGSLVVVEREALVREADGETAARIRERQIVRRRPQGPPPRAPAASASPAPAAVAPSPRGGSEVDLGDEIGPWQRPGTPPEQVGRYVAGNDMREGLFTDPGVARGLGYRGIVVPGPMLTAFLEHFLRAELAGWRLERLSTTFRIPTIAGEPIVLRGVVSEHDGDRIVCDVVIEHAGGERAVTGVARLRPERDATRA